MTKPIRIQLSRKRGFNLQEVSRATNGLNAVIVARPSKWGNPFRVGRDGDAHDCVAQFRRNCEGSFNEEDRRALAGKNLACWCGIGLPCHAEVLLELANK